MRGAPRGRLPNAFVGQRGLKKGMPALLLPAPQCGAAPVRLAGPRRLAGVARVRARVERPVGGDRSVVRVNRRGVIRRSRDGSTGSGRLRPKAYHGRSWSSPGEFRKRSRATPCIRRMGRPKGVPGLPSVDRADRDPGPAAAPDAEGLTGATGATGATVVAGAIGAAGATGTAGATGPNDQCRVSPFAVSPTTPSGFVALRAPDASRPRRFRWRGCLPRAPAGRGVSPADRGAARPVRRRPGPAVHVASRFVVAGIDGATDRPQISWCAASWRRTSFERSRDG